MQPQMLEELAVCNVRRAWAFHLDLREWGKLPACFHADARVTVAWFSGPIAEFITRSICRGKTHLRKGVPELSRRDRRRRASEIGRWLETESPDAA